MVPPLVTTTGTIPFLFTAIGPLIIMEEGAIIIVQALGTMFDAGIVTITD